MFNNIIAIIRRMIKKKVNIILKFWQINVIINMIYKKKDIIISAGIEFSKNLLYQLILLIKKKL